VKVAERREAVRLRGERGLPVKEIALRVGVSASTASRWLRDVPLTPAQQVALDRADPVRAGRRTGTERSSARRREERVAAQAHGRELARRAAPLHVAGCMLYWAEGSKRRNTAMFTNSDPAMLRYFLRFLRECYAVRDSDVALAVNVHLGNGCTIDDVHEWWLRELSLPRDSLRAPSINRASRATSRRRNTLPYGTARISVCSTFVVQSIYGAIQEYCGTPQPAWLDLSTR
jgi:transposase-like protein